VIRKRHDYWQVKVYAGSPLVFFYTQAQPAPDSPLMPGAVFGHIEMATGLTRDEARADWLSRPHLRTGLPPRTDEHTQEVWLPPPQPAPVSSIRTPFPSVGLATFAPGRSSLQDVNWGGATGFDDEGTSDLRVPDGAQPRFLILQVPASLRWRAGAEHTTSIPIEEHAAAEGGSVPVVNLDPIVPGDVSAACGFPADDATREVFETAPAAQDNLGPAQWLYQLQAGALGAAGEHPGDTATITVPSAHGVR
jgi:hypothetical protein